MEDIYVLAHEIKNPLCVARGYLEMLDEKNLDKYRKIIQKEIDSSLEILDNYLEYGKLSLQKEELDLTILLCDVKKKLEDFLEEKKISLQMQLNDEEIYVEGDYNKLIQVFYNIIKNSCEEHSTKIMINYAIKTDFVEITIHNNGNLIKQDNLDKIGDNFSTKILGNGIGTTLSKKIIMMHGGEIKYLNSNDGVNIIITLPLN